jgi:Lon protease-like protein
LRLHERYRRPSDLASDIPLFPLLGVVLLPRTQLPLHVFEPRYLAMIEHVLAGPRLLGIVQPVGEGGDTGSPAGKSAPLNRVGTAGRLTSFRELEDGRLAITLTGVCRFVVGAELTTDEPYRIARVDYAPFAEDLVPDAGDDAVDRAHLLAVLEAQRVAGHLSIEKGALDRAPTEIVVNAISVGGPFSPAERQALLEAPSLAERGRILVALAEMALAATTDGRPGGEGEGEGGVGPRLQ